MGTRSVVLIALAILLVQIVPLALAAWREPPDGELRHGVVSFGLLELALAVPALQLLDGVQPWDVLVTAGLFSATVFVASTNWRPVSLRFTALLGLLLVVVGLVIVGKGAAREEEARDAEAQVLAIAATVERLEAVPEDEWPASTAATDVLASVVEAKASVADACAAVIAAYPVPEPGDTGTPDDSDEPDRPCAERAATGADTHGSLAMALALARLDLAELRLVVDGRAEDTAAVKDATAALKTARATSPQWQARELDLAEAVELGGAAVVAPFLGMTRDDEAPVPADEVDLSVSPVAWLLLLIAALLFWRWIERRSARQLAGPVEVQVAPFSAGTPDTSASQKAVLRSALLRNVSEPDAVPGSDALTSLTDLVEIVPGSGWLATVTKALRAIVTAPTGYKVTAEVVPSIAEGGAWKVLVRVADRGNGRDAVVASVIGRTAPEACRAAGYWAAAEVLRRSTRIPAWARWRPESATALAAFDDAGDVGAAQPTVVDLQRATSVAPHSGVLLHRLADAYDLDGRRVDAMSTYARAVAAHPRYPTALYRLAASLAMLSRDPKAWYDTGAVAQTRTAGQLARAGDELGLREEIVSRLAILPGCDREAARELFRDVALKLLRHIETTQTSRLVVWRSLRRSERDTFWPVGLRKLHSRRSRLWWIVRTSELMLLADGAAPRPGPGEGRVPFRVRRMQDHKRRARLDKAETMATKKAKKPTSFWQISYVLACYHATAAQLPPRNDREDAEARRMAEEDRTEALTWLETALERPDCAQMGGGWLGKDPDLQPLAGLPRFVWLAENIDDTRKVAPDV